MTTATPTFTQYYNMWVERMSDEKHNPTSLAMHYGYHPNPSEPLESEEAKLTTNMLIANAINMDNYSTVADLGCGVGGTAICLAANYPGSTIAAVNIHTPQLELMQQYPQFPEGNVMPVNADFSLLPFASDTLDCAYAVDSSCYAANKLQFYQEALRCIKPNGKLAVFDVFYGREAETTEEKELVEHSCSGWMVPNWHNTDVNISGAELEFTEVTENVMPDIERSYQIAVRKIETTTDAIMRGHYQAIIALHDGLKSGLLKYGLMVAKKI
jgi:cyclopropane fatty-acyl-phospholipid synthase-like methyltransferase